jgi:hypothetical protein
LDFGLLNIPAWSWYWVLLIPFIPSPVVVAPRLFLSNYIIFRNVEIFTEKIQSTKKVVKEIINGKLQQYSNLLK